jgi:hypothetical protein
MDIINDVTYTHAKFTKFFILWTTQKMIKFVNMKWVLFLNRMPKPGFIYKAKWHHTNHEYIDSITSQIMKGSVHHK